MGDRSVSAVRTLEFEPWKGRGTHFWLREMSRYRTVVVSEARSSSPPEPSLHALIRVFVQVARLRHHLEESSSSPDHTLQSSQRLLHLHAVGPDCGEDLLRGVVLLELSS